MRTVLLALVFVVRDCPRWCRKRGLKFPFPELQLRVLLEEVLQRFEVIDVLEPATGLGLTADALSLAGFARRRLRIEQHA